MGVREGIHRNFCRLIPSPAPRSGAARDSSSTLALSPQLRTLTYSTKATMPTKCGDPDDELWAVLTHTASSTSVVPNIHRTPYPRHSFQGKLEILFLKNPHDDDDPGINRAENADKGERKQGWEKARI